MRNECLECNFFGTEVCYWCGHSACEEQTPSVTYEETVPIYTIPDIQEDWQDDIPF